MNMLDSIVDAISKKSAAGQAFDAALERGDTEFCVALIEQKPALATRIERDMHGQDTFLMAAVRHGNAEVVTKLLENGARLNLPLKYAGDHETPLTSVMRSDYQHPAVRDALLDHYVEQRQSPPQLGVLDQVKAKAISLMGSITQKLDALIQQPGITLAGINTVPAALGTAIGASAAGVAIAPMVPALAGAAAVGVSAALVSSLRSDRMPDELASRHLDAEQTVARMAATHEPRRDRRQLSNDRDPSSVEQASKTLAEDYVYSNKLEAKPINQDSGRYAGPLIHQTAQHVVQDVGRGSTVIHNKAKLDARAIDAAINLAKSTRIQYSDGRASIDAGVGQSQANSRTR